MGLSRIGCGPRYRRCLHGAIASRWILIPPIWPDPTRRTHRRAGKAVVLLQEARLALTWATRLTRRRWPWAAEVPCRPREAEGVCRPSLTRSQTSPLPSTSRAGFRRASSAGQLCDSGCVESREPMPASWASRRTPGDWERTGRGVYPGARRGGAPAPRAPGPPPPPAPRPPPPPPPPLPLSPPFAPLGAGFPPHTVTYDGYSLMIDGKRTYIWSGEFHYLPAAQPGPVARRAAEDEGGRLQRRVDLLRLGLPLAQARRIRLHRRPRRRQAPRHRPAGRAST